MKDVQATSGIRKLEAYGKKINWTKSTLAYALAFFLHYSLKEEDMSNALDRSSSFNYPSFSCFQ